MRRTKADAELTREALLDAAETVFLRDGVRHTSLTDIAKQALVTRGAIYWHFANKDAILLALITRVKLPQQFFAGIEADDITVHPFVRLLDAGLAVMGHLQASRQTRRLCAILMLRCEASEGIEQSVEYVDQADILMKAAIKTQFKRAAFDGILGDGWTVEEAATLYRCAIGGVVKEWLKDDTTFKLDILFRLAINALFDSLVRPMGQAFWQTHQGNHVTHSHLQTASTQ